MADERFRIEFDLSGAASVVQGLQAAASVLGGVGGGGGSVGATLLQVGRLNLALGAATAAFAGISVVARQVGQTLQELASTRFGLGSSAGTSAFAQMLGEAVGVRDIAGLGASLQQASLQGLGVSIAGRYGIPYQPSELGGAVDRGDIIMKVIEGLRRTAQTRGMNAAIGEARTLGGGAEQLLPLTLLPPEELARVRELARLHSQMFSPERIVAGVRLNLALAEMNAQFNDMQSLLAGPLTASLKVVNDFLRGRDLSQILAGGIAGLFGGKGPMDANTEAVNKNTAALENWGTGAFGGGSRAAGAIPGAFGVDAGAGKELDRYLRAGAFSIAPSSAGM